MNTTNSRVYRSSVVVYLIEYVTYLVQVLLGLRFVLKLFGARTAAPFVRWIYEMSDGLIAPFRGMFPSPEIARPFVIEFSTLFALIIYSVVGYLILELIGRLEATVRKH